MQSFLSNLTFLSGFKIGTPANAMGLGNIHGE